MRQQKFYSRYLIYLLGVLIQLFVLNNDCCARATGVKPGTDTMLIKNLIEGARKIADPDSAISAFNATFQMSVAGNYTKGILVSLNNIGNCNRKKANYAQCIATSMKALSFCTTPFEKATFYRTIGKTYHITGDYTKASEYYYEGLKELQKIRPFDSLSATTYVTLSVDISNIYGVFGQYDKTISWLNDAESIARKWRIYKQLVMILQDKSVYYQCVKQPNTRDLTEALSIVEKYKIKELESSVYAAFASVYYDLGRYEQAIQYFRRALDPAKLSYCKDPDDLSISSSYGIGECLFHLKKYKEAEEIIVAALKKAARLQIKNNYVDAYVALTAIYRETGQYKKALDCMDTVGRLNETSASVEKANAINQLEIKYKTAEKDRQLAQNQLMMAQQNTKIARKNVWIIAIAGGILVLLLSSVAAYVHLINKQRSLEKESKIGVLKAAVAGGDNERSRIARELHDGIGGMLSAAMMRFSSMHHEEQAINQTAAYNEAMKILREMGDEIRKTAHNLMPDVLLKQSLPEAVRVFCSSVQENGAQKIDFQYYGQFDDLSQSHKLNLYRVIQELIKNVLAHAEAPNVLVQLLRNEHKLIVSVEDNGKGFKVSETKGGIGLYNIRTRVSSLDGNLIIESEPGKGTTVIIELELPETGTMEHSTTTQGIAVS